MARDLKADHDKRVAAKNKPTLVRTKEKRPYRLKLGFHDLGTKDADGVPRLAKQGDKVYANVDLVRLFGSEKFGYIGGPPTAETDDEDADTDTDHEEDVEAEVEVDEETDVEGDDEGEDQEEKPAAPAKPTAPKKTPPAKRTRKG